MKTLQYPVENTAQKMKFSIKDFFSKCDQIRSFLKKSLMENFFCAVETETQRQHVMYIQCLLDVHLGNAQTFLTIAITIQVNKKGIETTLIDFTFSSDSHHKFRAMLKQFIDEAELFKMTGCHLFLTRSQRIKVDDCFTQQAITASKSHTKTLDESARCLVNMFKVNNNDTRGK